MIIFTITLVLFAACGKKENIVQEHFKSEKILFGTYIVEFDVYLENIGYSGKIAGLIEKLIYNGMSFDDYIANAQNEFIGPVTSDDFPPLTGGDGETYFYKSFFNESYKIIHHDKSFIVIEYNEYYYYTGAAHGNYWTNYFVIDVVQEKILDVSDLMNPVGEDSLKELIANEYDITHFLRQNIWPPDTININADNVVLLWNTYTITPYSDGLIGLVLYEDKYLTGKGKALQAVIGRAIFTERKVFMDLKLIFLIILGVVSVIYLTTLFFKEGVFQFILKGLLIPCIFAVYVSGADKIFLPIALALVFAWIGDVLLIKISNILCFRLGLASFLIGHICYITAMFGFGQPFNIPFLVICFIAGAGLGFLIYKIIQPPPEMKIAVIAYESIILVMAIFAVQLFASQGGSFGALVLAGSICFVASDTSLALVTFRKKPYYVFVMVTYIAAQLLIALGFCV